VKIDLPVVPFVSDSCNNPTEPFHANFVFPIHQRIPGVWKAQVTCPNPATPNHATKENEMISAASKYIRTLACLGLAIAVPGLTAQAQYGGFQLKSSTFTNDSVLPISAILNNQVSGVNTCSINGAAGGDTSPELSWTGAPYGTQSFVVVTYDVTAGFTHWGIYNIKGSATGLPAGAGVAGSTFGQQIENDFGLGQEYDGPCPPTGIAPDSHQYVFTVYALCVPRLTLPGSTNFPSNAEALYHALILAGQNDEILGTASLTGFYSSTPPAAN
jgi:Raf kinase inhibitor-like YbhB/YbcL family protein